MEEKCLLGNLNRIVLIVFELSSPKGLLATSQIAVNLRVCQSSHISLRSKCMLAGKSTLLNERRCMIGKELATEKMIKHGFPSIMCLPDEHVYAVGST